ncbi:hypothetical protein HPB47_010735 [Ixodes persulcatus]|uniref:Uncharacterized protein n=1 Tax=Ixodes persulcatus TaxID=34615 RepID=A0AC60NY85_IXOPE|nr:hypothetical protein HPB47_010735 [Ixodes persulcatus]
MPPTLSSKCTFPAWLDDLMFGIQALPPGPEVVRDLRNLPGIPGAKRKGQCSQIGGGRPAPFIGFRFERCPSSDRASRIPPTLDAQAVGHRLDARRPSSAVHARRR